MKTSVILLSLLLLSGAYGSSSSQAAQGAQSSDAPSLDQQRAASVLAEIHHVNQKEIKLAQLALEKTQSPLVKAFAQKMITDHQSADDKVQMLAQARNVDLGSFEPNDAEQAKMESLKKLSGSGFDQAYLDTMKTGHQEVYDNLKTAQAGIKDPQVASLIANLLPTVKDHEKIAQADEKRTEPSTVAD